MFPESGMAQCENSKGKNEDGALLSAVHLPSSASGDVFLLESMFAKWRDLLAKHHWYSPMSRISPSGVKYT